MRIEVPCVTCHSFASQCSWRMIEIEQLRLNETGVINRQLVSRLSLRCPVVGQWYLIAIRYQTERMIEVVLISGRWIRFPIDELHCALEAGIATAHPLLFGNAEEVEENGLQVWHSRFPHADPWNRRRFDNRDVHSRHCLLEVRSRHPASGAAADNYDFLDEIIQVA